MSTEKYNKEQIRNRMLKYAAAFWGIKKAENFDPVVKLLLEALSNEVYMLGEDFTAIETRLLEKTARILTPGILTSPFPAHGIVHAYPIEPCYQITRESGMYYESDSLTRKLSTGSVSFYPACDTLLHKADVKYMVCDDLLYRIAPTLEKTMIARTETRMPPRTVWLGVAVDESISDLEDFSFYLDFPNLMESYEYLLLLPCTEWSVEGKPVVMERGIHERTTIPEEPTRAFFQNYDVMSVIDREVMDIYSKHFLKVSQSFPFDSSWKKNLPDILRSCFKEAVLEKMQDKLVWVKIQFPAHFTPEVLEGLLGINDTWYKRRFGEITDFNEANNTGYMFVDKTQSLDNKPNTSSNYGFLETIAINEVTIKQTFVDFQSRFFIRICNNGTWTDWKQIQTT